jgi:hypothetical protein
VVVRSRCGGVDTPSSRRSGWGTPRHSLPGTVVGPSFLPASSRACGSSVHSSPAQPACPGEVHPLQRPRWDHVGHCGGLTRLLSVGEHKPRRTLGRPSFPPPARRAGPSLAAEVGVPESNARVRTRRSARPRQPTVVNGYEGSRHPCNHPIYTSYFQGVLLGLARIDLYVGLTSRLGVPGRPG